MQIITIIDSILQNAIIRWALAGLVVVLTVIITVQTVRLKASKLQLQAEKGTSAEYAAKLAAQNDAIKKAGEDMQAMEKQAQDASEKVAALKKQLQQRKVEIKEVVLRGDCPDMVQQVLDEVRK